VSAREDIYNLSIFYGVAEKKEKAFFFEKKKQKTFMSSDRFWRKVRDSDPKVFWFFFSKKNCFSR